MLTPQEVAERSFPKATLGGYNMAQVDEFLDELTEDYSSLYKENAVLKQKLKVLVEKVEEYRATEDSMRATLLAAQRMADSIVADAEAKKQAMVDEAASSVSGKVTELEAQIADAETRLALAQQKFAEYVAFAKGECAKQMAFLETVPTVELTAPVAAPAAVEAAPAAVEEKSVDETVEDIESSILAAFAAEEEEAPAQEKPEGASLSEVVAEEYDDSNPFADDPIFAQTRKMDLKDLKFGRNYTGEE